MHDKDKRREYLTVDLHPDELIPRARARCYRMKTVVQKKYGSVGGPEPEKELNREAQRLIYKLEWYNTKLEQVKYAQLLARTQKQVEELKKADAEFEEFTNKLVYTQWQVGEIYRKFVEIVGVTNVGIR